MNRSSGISEAVQKQPRSECGLDIVMRVYGVPSVPPHESPRMLFDVLQDAGSARRLGLDSHERGPGTYYYRADWPQVLRPLRRPVYRAVLPHFALRGPGLQPLLVNAAGEAVVAWYGHGAARRLAVGLDIVEEVVRYRQGDPGRVNCAPVKSAFGFEFERANYLFDEQVSSRYPTTPWTDNLGFLLAAAWSRQSGYPLIEPLPAGARAAVALTGDDDQAYLEKYGEQLRAVAGTVPVTYFLHPLTRHRRETIAAFPKNVEIGVHPDALETPQEYESLCIEQTTAIESLTGRKARVVRNHGYLNRSYLGHLPAWEAAGLVLDTNYTAADGTTLTASFLPMRCRRPDGVWSRHWSLLTAFGDGMISALKMSERAAVKRVRRIAHRVEHAGPGVLVFNLHPQNIDSTRRLHATVVALASRPGWSALGLESYLRWLEAVEGISMERDDGTLALRSTQEVHDVVLRVPDRHGWLRQALEPWSGDVEIQLTSSHDVRHSLRSSVEPSGIDRGDGRRGGD